MWPQFAILAQLVEQRFCKPQVEGSSPSDGLTGDAMDPIKIDPEIMSGTPCFAGTRAPVRTLFDVLEHGKPLDEFLVGFPTVMREQALAVLELAKQRVTAA
jgi:uncharacterized protein (DUF433 family)